MKKNANGSGPARRDPLPDRSAERADRRNRRRLEDGKDGPRIVTAPRDDLRNLELHREWVAPGQARHRRMRRRRRIASALVLIAVLAALAVAVPSVGRALGWFGGPSPTAGPTVPATSTGGPTPTEGPSPSPSPSSTPGPSPLPAAERAKLFTRLQSDLAALVAAQPAGRYAIYYRSLANDETWGLRATDPFVAASSIKMGINTYLYDQVKAGKVAFDEMLAFDRRAYPTGDLESGTGTVQFEADGTKHSVEETSRLSIRISDNCATNMILRRLGGIDAVNAAFFRPLGPVVDYRTKVSYTNYLGAKVAGLHRTCAQDLGRTAEALYMRYVEDPAFYGPLIDDLEHTEFGFSLPNRLPKTVAVAHKIGTNEAYDTENDVGIVFATEPFVLCVMTETASASGAHAFTAEVAKRVYDFVETAATGVAPG